MYKVSKYNYFVASDERMIYLNGMTGNSFSVSQKEHENLSKLFDDLALFHSRYTSVFKRFKEWGFIVSEDLDELGLIRFRNKQAVFMDKSYRLVLNPTEDCIFNCWYCTQHGQNTGKMGKDVIERVKKHIRYMIENEKVTGFTLDWFGGEPLIYFDDVIYPIAKYALKLIKKHNLPYHQQATTNGYLITPAMVEKMKEVNFKSFQITIDGDEKRHDAIRNVKGAPTFKKIIENVVLLCDTIPEIKIVLRLNYDNRTLVKSNMEAVFFQIPEHHRSKINLSFQRVWQTIDRRSRDEENPQLKELYEMAVGLGYSPLISNALHVGERIRCYGDRFYHTVINYNGKVYKCTARTAKEAGILHDTGYIEWNPEVLSRLFAKATFENEKCLECKYLPICLGNCIHRLNDDRCILDYDDMSADFFIREFHHRKMDFIRQNYLKNEAALA
jgi:uncharacterized protein